MEKKLTNMTIVDWKESDNDIVLTALRNLLTCTTKTYEELKAKFEAKDYADAEWGATMIERDELIIADLQKQEQEIEKLIPFFEDCENVFKKQREEQEVLNILPEYPGIVGEIGSNIDKEKIKWFIATHKRLDL